MGLLDWVRQNEALLYWLGFLSLLLFAAGIFLVPFVIVRIPADYFVRKSPDERAWGAQPPLPGILLRVAKNILGALLLLAGVAMLALPGQGVLTILLGVTLLEFPGKRRLELWIVRRRSVGRVIGWLRQRAHRAPLELPEAAREGAGRDDDA